MKYLKIVLTAFAVGSIMVLASVLVKGNLNQTTPTQNVVDVGTYVDIEPSVEPSIQPTPSPTVIVIPSYVPPRVNDPDPENPTNGGNTGGNGGQFSGGGVIKPGTKATRTPAP